MTEIDRRKTDHLDLAMRAEMQHQRSNLLECVEFVHDALPECHRDEISTEVTLLGRRLRAPLIVAGMTGGTPRARDINRSLARVVEAAGLALGLGSQRAMLEDPSKLETYRVREEMPTALLFGNIGGVQAARLPTSRVEELVGSVGADALCIHLNPAMELAQPEGDRDFRGILDAITRLSAELPVPVVVKETGCGLSRGVGRRLRAAGISHVDVSGAGGTSFVAIEQARHSESNRTDYSAFRDWGIPTGASLVELRPLGFSTVIATGGMSNGLDVARAIALGADAAGLARTALVALSQDGEEGLAALLERAKEELRTVMVLSQARTVAELKAVPCLIHPPLARWMRRHDVGGGEA